MQKKKKNGAQGQKLGHLTAAVLLTPLSKRCLLLGRCTARSHTLPHRLHTAAVTEDPVFFLVDAAIHTYLTLGKLSLSLTLLHQLKPTREIKRSPASRMRSLLYILSKLTSWELKVSVQQRQYTVQSSILTLCALFIFYPYEFLRHLTHHSFTTQRMRVVMWQAQCCDIAMKRNRHDLSKVETHDHTLFSSC